MGIGNNKVKEGVTYYYYLESLVTNGTTSTIATSPTAIQLSTLGQTSPHWDGTLLILLVNLIGYVWYRSRQ